MVTRLSSFAFAILILVLLFLALRGDLFSRNPISIGLQIAAVAMNLWGRASFRKGSFRFSPTPSGDGIHTAGPYRWIRHPMYAAVLLFLWTGISFHWSLINAAAGVVAIAVALCRIHVEERMLRERYPEYAAYARRTKRLIPYLL